MHEGAEGRGLQATVDGRVVLLGSSRLMHEKGLSAGPLAEQASRLEGEGRVTFAVDALDLVAGTYKLDVALHKLDGFPYDYHRLLYSFRVKSRTQDAGLYRPRHAWSFGGGVSFKERVAGS